MSRNLLQKFNLARIETQSSSCQKICYKSLGTWFCANTIFNLHWICRVGSNDNFFGFVIAFATIIFRKLDIMQIRMVFHRLRWMDWMTKSLDLVREFVTRVFRGLLYELRTILHQLFSEWIDQLFWIWLETSSQFSRDLILHKQKLSFKDKFDFFIFILIKDKFVTYRPGNLYIHVKIVFFLV